MTVKQLAEQGCCKHAPMKGRKLARNSQTAVEGRVAIILAILLNAKETWISSGRLTVVVDYYIGG